jgi:hypothetical protein
MRAEERVMPICAPMLGPNSDIADLAEAGAAVPTAGSKAGLIITVGRSANIDGQLEHSGSKRKACNGFNCSHSPDAISVQHISPKVPYLCSTYHPRYLLHHRSGTQEARPLSGRVQISYLN